MRLGVAGYGLRFAGLRVFGGIAWESLDWEIMPGEGTGITCGSLFIGIFRFQLTFFLIG